MQLLLKKISSQSSKNLVSKPFNDLNFRKNTSLHLGFVKVLLKKIIFWWKWKVIKGKMCLDICYLCPSSEMHCWCWIKTDNGVFMGKRVMGQFISIFPDIEADVKTIQRGERGFFYFWYDEYIFTLLSKWNQRLFRNWDCS